MLRSQIFCSFVRKHKQMHPYPYFAQIRCNPKGDMKVFWKYKDKGPESLRNKWSAWHKTSLIHYIWKILINQDLYLYALGQRWRSQVTWMKVPVDTFVWCICINYLVVLDETGTEINSIEPTQMLEKGTPYVSYAYGMVHKIGHLIKEHILLSSKKEQLRICIAR